MSDLYTLKGMVESVLSELLDKSRHESADRPGVASLISSVNDVYNTVLYAGEAEHRRVRDAAAEAALKETEVDE